MPENRCPICGSHDTGLHLDDEEEALDASSVGSSRRRITHGRIQRCRTCGFGFRQLRSSPEEMAEIYGRMDVGVYESQMAGRIATAKRHLDIVTRFTSGGPGRLLDVGCASGYFLREAQRAKWSVVGVEPSETLYVKAVDTLGADAEIHCSILEHAKLPRASFDAVSLWDVLEHVSDPAGFMALCAALLKPGGTLFVNVPDLDSPQSRLMGKRWPLLLAEHLNYFNRSSLGLCAHKAGLEWIHFGRRRVSFSLDYILLRLSQHHVPGAALVRRAATPAIGATAIPIHVGEILGVWRR